MLIFLKTFLLTEVFELSLVPNRSQEPLSSSINTTDVLLTVTAHLETLLVILQTDIGAELFDVTPESDTILAQTGGLNLLLT